MSPPLRIVVLTNIRPVAVPLVAALRELGHEPVAVLAQRRVEDDPRLLPVEILLDNLAAPFAVDLVFTSAKERLEPLLRAYAPDLMLCWGFAWKIPQAALDVPRLGSVNLHPALLPRHRGPVPFAWAFRDGDSQFGVTWHRMDAELDTGNLLAQAAIPMLDTDTTITDFAPRIQKAAFSLLPKVLERVLAGDPGDPQPAEGATWAGHFEQDYADVDFSRSARDVHNQVRAWNLTFGLSMIEAPVAELDGERVRLVRTSLTDPGAGARRVECADGPLWVLEAEPLA